MMSFIPGTKLEQRGGGVGRLRFASDGSRFFGLGQSDSLQSNDKSMVYQLFAIAVRPNQAEPKRQT